MAAVLWLKRTPIDRLNVAKPDYNIPFKMDSVDSKSAEKEK